MINEKGRTYGSGPSFCIAASLFTLSLALTDDQNMERLPGPPCDGPSAAVRPSRDTGSSFVELLVSIALLGTVIVAVLVTLQTSVGASSIGRDHANAHAWLQTASDILYSTPREDCGTASLSVEPAIRATYQSTVRGTSNPENWLAANIEIVPPVLFWDGVSTYQTTCFDDSGINLQLITIQVRAPDGRIVETVQVVKG